MNDNENDIDNIATDPRIYAKIHAHMDIIRTCHFPIADIEENRKIFEDHACLVCAKIKCTGKGRCKATSLTFAQLNLLTPIVSYRDEGSVELGIIGFDRVMTIGHALRPFNPLLADYFDEKDVQILHCLVCLAKNKDDLNIGRLVIPKEYNVRVEKIEK